MKAVPREPPKLSIVIPTIGRNEVLVTTVACLLAQRLQDWECLVINQGDPLRAELFRMNGRAPQIQCLQCGEPNASLARNIGLANSRAEIVLFLDDDLVIETPRFLDAHLDHYSDPAVSGVHGQVLSPSRKVRLNRHWLSYLRRVGWLYFPSNFAYCCSLATGASNNLSVRRHWALHVGGMDAQFEKGAHREESDFCLRYTAKYGPLLFEPAASVVHLGVSSGGCRTWGANRGIHPIHHVTGEWYFLLKGLRQRYILKRDLPHHLLHLWRRQIWNEENRWRLPRVRAASLQSVEGLRLALGKIRAGPRYWPSMQNEAGCKH